MGDNVLDPRVVQCTGTDAVDHDEAQHVEVGGSTEEAGDFEGYETAE